MARTKTMQVPEVGEEAPEFNLPSAQGGQLRLSMRTARGPVVVVFFRGAWSEEDVEYFKALSTKEDEINHAGASIVGIGAVEPDEARDFARASGIKSYVLYDYVRITGRQWGVLQKDKEHGEYTRPAAFIVGPDHKIANAWVGDLPAAGEILAKVSEITGLPKPAEAEEEKPEQDAAGGDDKPRKMSAEERERIKAERRAAREAGESVKSSHPGVAASERTAEQADKPKKMSAEERERIKAERRAAREAGKSLKQPTSTEPGSEASSEAPRDEASEKPKKMSAEERERIKAERRAAREAGRSLKQPTSGENVGAGAPDKSASAEAAEAPEVGSEEPQGGSPNKAEED
ncbi:MAG: redoxin domain-containing protein [Actinomycetota bacterium]|nr:redoxin domain-containing protein [Actinomycetota bacterium]